MQRYKLFDLTRKEEEKVLEKFLKCFKRPRQTLFVHPLCSGGGNSGYKLGPLVKPVAVSEIFVVVVLWDFV